MSGTVPTPSRFPGAILEHHPFRSRDMPDVAHAAPADKLVNGPKLEGDIGHADQSEIDRMFAVIG